MIKLLGAIAIIGTAWAGSHYLTPSTDELDAPPAASARSTSSAAPGSSSVALLDFAVAVLPQVQSTQINSAEPAHLAVAAVPSPVEAKAQTEPSSPEPTDAEAEADLARQLQVELRRVGCLKTSADGVWGRASQRAMRRFADKIDASLPTDRPDTVLLMLVEKYQDRACGTPCAIGEQPDARGRCQARTEIAAVESEPEAVASAVESIDAEAANAAPPMALVSTDPTRASARKSTQVRTKISQMPRTKMARVARVKARRTVWSAPAYGLGMVQAKPAKTTKKRKRVGASAAYRRWMSRTGMNMR